MLDAASFLCRNGVTVKDIPLIAFRNVQKRFLGKEPIFSGISADIFRGEFTFLTGVSGAGKSTLFRMLMGLEKPDTGSILFNGQDVVSTAGDAMCRHRRSIGMIFQDYKLLSKRSAVDNIAIPLHIHGMTKSSRNTCVNDISSKLKISKLLKQSVQSLSGGEQQLVAIARAAVHKPALILADEPTANLDQKMATRIIDMLKLLNREGITILVATHDINLLKAQRSRILLLKHSELIEVH